MRGGFTQTFSPGRFLAGTLAALWLWGVGAFAQAQDWAAPARDLADQLRRQIPPPARLAWTVQNRSTLSEGELRSVRRAISAELRGAGYRAGQPYGSVAQVRISVSENFQNFLWVAQVLREETKSVVMVTIPRIPAAPPRETSSIVISRKLLLTREEPILDLTMIPAPGLPSPRLLVLGRSSVAVYEMSGTAWQVTQTAPIAGVRVWPRDVRGRLSARPDGTFEASLPGERCLGSVTLLANLDCHASDEPWPVADTPGGTTTAHFVPDRNYFTGPLLVANNQPLPVRDFYSAIVLGNRKDSPWLVATTDSQVRLLSSGGVTAEFHGWGSQLAAIKSACGSGALVIATRPSDFAEPDAVQALQIRGRNAERMSTPVEFTGPVTLLRDSGEEGSAFAVVHALPAGLYEAYRLSINCSD